MGGDFFGEEVMGFSCFEQGVPPLRGVLLSFASPKESKQRKGDPGSVPASRVPCATRLGRGLRNSGLKPLKQCSPFFRPSLRCSAPLKGPGKPPGAETGAATIGTGANLIFAPFCPSTATDQYGGKAVEPKRFWAPLRGAEQRRNAGGSRLALSEPQASLASRPAFRVAQGTGAAGADPGVAFSLATFFWPHKRKYARQQGGNPCQPKPRSQKQRNQPC
jgi:hypothetical protein